MAQKWEYKWIPMWWKGSMLQAGHYEIKLGDRTLKGQDVTNYIDSLGNEARELVSAVPEVVGHGAAGSFTDGYMLWFKRPKS